MFGIFTSKRLRKRIKELEKEQENYSVLVANTPDLLYRTDPEGRITFVSSSVESLSGYTVEEAVGMKMAEEVYLNGDERKEFLALLQKDGSVKNFQARLKRKDGSIWWASTNAKFYRDPNGVIIGVEGVTRNVDDLKKAEEARQKSEELFRLAFHTSPDSINLNRASDGMYIDINEGFTKALGYTREETIGRTSISLNIWRNPDDRERLVKGLREQGYVENLEADFQDKYGGVHTGLMSARILQIDGEQIILSVTRDISARIQLEDQLQEAQKLEALGILAGGIAHDFNNLLMGIQGRASLIGNSLRAGNPILDHIREIEDCVRSATHLTRQVLGFARGGKYETSPVDFNELLKKSGGMFGRTHKEIALHFELAPVPVVAEVDKTQVEQVLLNIFVNAQQAMPRGGDIFIETSIQTPSREFCQAYRVPQGEYCRISIRDTGAGMSEATRRAAFDPFFTTKEKERGTGLGLASALGIIKNHKGVITLSSRVNNGTTVDIYLPLSKAEPIKEEQLPEVRLNAGKETILLVDDEVLVTDVGEKMLELLGYKAFIANSGAEALKILAERGADIHLVILDLVMPRMDGEEAFTAIRKLYPQMPVLLSSGYSMNGQVSDLLSKGCNSFIQKPFNLQEFSHKLRTILDNPGAG